eukprot:3940225-Rhodomonas_salina.2
MFTKVLLDHMRNSATNAKADGTSLACPMFTNNQGNLDKFKKAFELAIKTSYPAPSDDDKGFTRNCTYNKTAMVQLSKTLGKKLLNMQQFKVTDQQVGNPMKLFASANQTVRNLLEETSPLTTRKIARMKKDPNYEDEEMARRTMVRFATVFIFVLQKVTTVGGVNAFSGVFQEVIRKVLLHTVNPYMFNVAFPRLVKVIKKFQPVRGNLLENLIKTQRSTLVPLQNCGSILLIVIVQEFMKHLPTSYQDWYKNNTTYKGMWDEVMDLKVEEMDSNELFSTSFANYYKHLIMLLFRHVQTLANLFAESGKTKEIQDQILANGFEDIHMLASLAVEISSKARTIARMPEPASPSPEDEHSRAATPTAPTRGDIKVNMLGTEAVAQLLLSAKKMAEEEEKEMNVANRKRKAEHQEAAKEASKAKRAASKKAKKAKEAEDANELATAAATADDKDAMEEVSEESLLLSELLDGYYSADSNPETESEDDDM